MFPCTPSPFQHRGRPAHHGRSWPGVPGPPADSRTPHAGDPCAQRGRATVLRMESTPPLIQARVGGLHRTGYLTPYLAELIIDDVRRRAGGRVEIRLTRTRTRPPSTPSTSAWRTCADAACA